MSTMHNDLIDTIDRVCEEHCTRALRSAAGNGRWPEALWQALDEVGLVRAALPESAGGPGLEFADAMVALRRTAYHAVPLPLAETMLAGRLLVAAGLEVPDGPLTVAPVAAGDRLNAWNAGARTLVSGIARRVPWGQACVHAVVVAEARDGGEPFVGLVATAGLAGAVEQNLAGEPRAVLKLEETPLLAAARLPGAGERLELEGALCRSVQMTGALERVLAYTLQYANERVQFGRAIGKFQAIQHMLAILAGHVAASSAVTDAAVEAAALVPDAFTVAVAKSRVGEAAGKATEIGHQVHGAMGYTHEHNLHHSTRRLWSWREEFGNETRWQVRLGREAARMGPDALWPMLSRLQQVAAS